MLMSKAAYARHCNVSRQTVYDWVAKGEVVMSGNKIDVDATKMKQIEEDREKSESGYDEESPIRISEKAAAVCQGDSAALEIKYEAFAATAEEAKPLYWRWMTSIHQQKAIQNCRNAFMLLLRR